jgi:hypothetical protein
MKLVFLSKRILKIYDLDISDPVLVKEGQVDGEDYAIRSFTILTFYETLNRLR